MSGQEVPSSTVAQPIVEDSVSVTDLAVQLGKRKQTVFKVIRRLSIEPQSAAALVVAANSSRM